MKISRLKLSGFRNIAEADLCFEAGVNILHGDNAQGKTALLEALWLFTGARSFRGARDADLVMLGRERALISLEFRSQQRDRTAAVIIEKGKRAATLDGVRLEKPSLLTGNLLMSVFSPEHLSYVKEGPDGRRRFLDSAIGQVSPRYAYENSRYKQILAQRAALLRDYRTGPVNHDLLDVYDLRLAKLGAFIIKSRMQYVERLYPHAARFYEGLSGGREQLTMRYISAKEPSGSVDDFLQKPSANSLTEGLQANMDTSNISSILYDLYKIGLTADIEAGATRIGPHRDDLELYLDTLGARGFGSQGQQRSIVLALKLAEAAVLNDAGEEQPVMLLDDVLSELDATRQDYILSHLDGRQIVITCCNSGGFTGGRVFHVKQGTFAENR